MDGLKGLFSGKALPWVIAGAAVLFILGILVGMGVGQGGSAMGLSGAAGINAICDASPLDLSTPTGIVTTDPLNMRSGPGMEYDILMMLDNCSQLDLLGRSSDGLWLQVSLNQYVSGWVFAQYVTTNVRINKLPVTQYVAPQPSSGTAKIVWVEIQMNYGAAFVKGMPANTNVRAVLSPAGTSGKDVVVGNATTDNAGATVISFVMPTTWADGSLVTEQDLVLETAAADGASATLFVTYYVR